MQKNNSQFSILNSQLFNRVYEGKTVLVTGHTGFKGSWLTLWLLTMGAKVIGYSLKPNTNPNHYELIIENGEWRMENGEWRMENGEWRRKK